LAGLRCGASEGGPLPTLLAVCPTSPPVVRAAIRACRDAQAPLAFAVTLYQVDVDGGYTGWTPARFVQLARELAREEGYDGPVMVGLDHGGPWTKEVQRRESWALARAMAGVKESLFACLQGGYDLLHIDATIDWPQDADRPLPIERVTARTLELIGEAEAFRRRQGLPLVSYEVGTEEVHGGLADMNVFRRFLDGLKEGLAARGFSDVWPCFVVGKVGTDLHTTEFDSEVAGELTRVLEQYGSTLKGHYTDWVSNPGAYPQARVGGANVGPEFSEVEYNALADLCRSEQELLAQDSGRLSGLLPTIREAVTASGRWERWRLPEEQGRGFYELSPERQDWMVRTACRYVWREPRVEASRRALGENLASAGIDAGEAVLSAISESVRGYCRAFELDGTLPRIEAAASSP
jgi:D-tagatose-1,6-bisphosphate aldolase subunit GatZ/KbaZ